MSVPVTCHSAFSASTNPSCAKSQIIVRAITPVAWRSEIDRALFTGLVIVCAFGSGTTCSVSDSVSSTSNTWNALTEQGGGEAMFYAYNPTVGSGHTFTCTAPYAYCMVSTWSGTSTASTVLDAQNGANSGSSNVTSLAIGSITPGTTGELIISGWNWSQGPPTGLAVSRGLTILDSYEESTYQMAADAYLVDSASTAINPTWSVSSPSGRMSATVAAFKHP